jgi:hypothetical protein
MRTILTATALVVAAAMAPVPVAAEGPTCPPNPLTQAHEPWMKMPSTAVDLHSSPPASATNPLMVNLPMPGPAVETRSAPDNPLTHRP